jgi:hypothetical protein
MVKSRRMRWAGHIAQFGEKRTSYRILAGKPEGKRPLGRLRHRSVGNIKMDLKRDRMGWYGLDRSGSGYAPVEGSCERKEPLVPVKYWEVIE